MIARPCWDGDKSGQLEKVMSDHATTAGRLPWDTVVEQYVVPRLVPNRLSPMDATKEPLLPPFAPSWREMRVMLYLTVSSGSVIEMGWPKLLFELIVCLVGEV